MGAFPYIKIMINILFAIPFGAAWLYYFAASRIQKRCFRTLTEEEKKEFDLGEMKDEEIRIFDASLAGRWLAVMSVCWFIGFPVIQLQKWLGL